MSDEALDKQVKAKEIRDRIEVLKHLSDDYAVEARQALEKELAVMEGAVLPTPPQQPVDNEQIMEETAWKNQKTEAEDKKTPTDEIPYTPMLSKFFPSFSGTCTKEDFKDVWNICFLSAILWGGLQALVTLLSADSLYLFILLSLLLGILYCCFCCKSFLPVLVRRFHSFGINYTCWYAVPTIAVAFLCIICGYSRSMEDGAALLMIAWLAYTIWITRMCLCKDSPEDKKLLALRKKTVYSSSVFTNSRTMSDLSPSNDANQKSRKCRVRARKVSAAQIKTVTQKSLNF